MPGRLIRMIMTVPFDTVTAGLLHELGTHHEVLLEELAGALLVDADAAHLRRPVDHHVGLAVTIGALHGSLIDQIVVAGSQDDDSP